jgi:hypothetical protein
VAYISGLTVAEVKGHPLPELEIPLSRRFSNVHNVTSRTDDIGEELPDDTAAWVEQERQVVGCAGATGPGADLTAGIVAIKQCYGFPAPSSERLTAVILGSSFAASLARYRVRRRATSSPEIGRLPL